MSAFDKISHGFKSLENNITKEVGNTLLQEFGFAGPNAGGNMDVLNSMKGLGQELPQGFPQVNDILSDTNSQSILNQAFRAVSQEGSLGNMLQPGQNITSSIEQQLAGGEGGPGNLLGGLTGGEGGLGNLLGGLTGGEGGLGNLLGGLTGGEGGPGNLLGGLTGGEGGPGNLGGLVGELVDGLMSGGGAGGVVEEVAPLAALAL